MAIPQIALTKAQRYATKHNTDAAVQLLRQYGADEQMAERITAMLAEQVDIFALMLCMSDIPARRLAFLSDNKGCIKMGGTVENFKSCVEFTCISAADIGALASLTRLEILYLHSNNINDVNALANLTNLQYLSLWDNNISESDQRRAKR